MVILRGLGGFAGFMLVALSTASVHTYWFSDQDDRAATALLSASVRIFETEKGEQIGSGFVIDSAQGLILSAVLVENGMRAHVWVAFREEEERNKPKILLPNSADDGNSTRKPDLSILQLAPPVMGVPALEVQFEDIEE